MKSRRCPGNAFTLIELLILVGLLILVLMLLPALLSRNPRPAFNLHCLTRLRQINIAIHMYAADWTHDASGETNNVRSPFLDPSSYRLLIAPYVSIKHPPSPQDQLFACPKDTFYYATNSKGPACISKPFHEQSNYVFSSYAYNAGQVIAHPTANSPATTNFHGIAGTWPGAVIHPARTVLVAEIPAFEPYSWHVQKKTFSQQNSRCNDSRNVVSFVDGHAAYIKMYFDGKNAAWNYNPPTGYDYQWTGD